MTDIDLELLARFTRDRVDEAFAELVRRHLNLVHSAALRQVRSPQLAEEVAQSTFLKLAHHARQLAPGTILSAWLYQVTRREAIDVVRREARRQLREQIATEMNAMNATAADWTHIEPLLDDAMAALDETDRTAVLLRYFENKSLREVGEALGASENAAQKRLARAVEHLREFFHQARHQRWHKRTGRHHWHQYRPSRACRICGHDFNPCRVCRSSRHHRCNFHGHQSHRHDHTAKTLVVATFVAAVGTGIYEPLLGLVEFHHFQADAVLLGRPAQQGIKLEVIKHTEAKRGFVLLPRRWVVERSFAWAARFRRLERDYERLALTLSGYHWLAFALLVLKNFTLKSS